MRRFLPACLQRSLPSFIACPEERRSGETEYKSRAGSAATTTVRPKHTENISALSGATP